MLFLNTLEVSAKAMTSDVTCSGSLSFVLHPQNGSSSVSPSSFSFTESGSIGSSGTIIRTSGSGSIVSSGQYESYYFVELDIPVMAAIDSAEGYGDYLGFNIWNLNMSTNQGSLINPYMHIGENYMLINYYTTKNSVMWFDGSDSTWKVTARPIIHCILTYSKADYSQVNQQINVTLNYSFFASCWDISAETFSATQPPVSDTGTHEQLDTLNETEQAVKDSVTNPDPNGKGLFETISDFFGSFFDNIINSFKSLFIPEDGFFTDWFTMLNTLLEAKLGMLYAPFGLIISLLTAIMSADSTEVGIPIPEISWTSDGVKTVLIEAQNFTFSSLGENFNDLRDKVYFATDTVIIFAFLMLLQAKVRHIINGHESG